MRVGDVPGIDGDELQMRRVFDDLESGVLRTHRTLVPLVSGVPHFIIREGSSGAGVELNGPEEVTGCRSMHASMHGSIHGRTDGWLWKHTWKHTWTNRGLAVEA